MRRRRRRVLDPIALFGKPADPDTATADLTNVSIEPLPMSMVDDLAEIFGYVVTDTRPVT